MREDGIISALIGLVGACGSNPKTANTDKVIVKALAFSLLHPEGDVSEAVEAIRAEKNTVAPHCAHCASPCGNTSDYDMERLYSAEDGVKKAKLRVLAELQKAAALLCRSGKEPGTDEGEFFCRALAWVGYDLPEERLLELLRETEALTRGREEKCAGEHRR